MEEFAKEEIIGIRNVDDQTGFIYLYEKQQQHSIENLPCVPGRTCFTGRLFVFSFGTVWFTKLS